MAGSASAIADVGGVGLGAEFEAALEAGAGGAPADPGGFPQEQSDASPVKASTNAARHGLDIATRDCIEIKACRNRRRI
jgi:hypothetical protein